MNETPSGLLTSIPQFRRRLYCARNHARSPASCACKLSLWLMPRCACEYGDGIWFVQEAAVGETERALLEAQRAESQVASSRHEMFYLSYYNKHTVI